MTQDEKFTYMTTTPVPKLISKLAVPTMISMLISALYNAADTYFVGQINVQASAAVGVIFSLMAIIQAFGFTFGHGSGIMVSIKLGEKDEKEARTLANSGFVYAILFGICWRWWFLPSGFRSLTSSVPPRQFCLIHLSI